jgi:hypothetical protein
MSKVEWLWRHLVRVSKLTATGSCGQGNFENPEEEEYLTLKTATEQWLEKT